MPITTAPNIAMDEIESSQLHAIGYDSASQTLAIRFKDRRTGEPTSLYHYYQFTPENWDAFRNAESFGSHFGKYIKPNKERFPYACIEQKPAPVAEAE
ncbi:KTSC domain-containing protein [Ralstonia insidiosa]|uniref:KTSC domain-containing protein n=1 Tax=Ralstonia insidiosa TaxID=190721 RepID=A0A848NP84_9RALS|nr:KTSC domain-containing protein [Ralstonia insidiosa]NMV36952.1 KTSC domain-containing protein [Ralstonia insidiosa]